jgi:carboxymethylenebutenolidase
MPSETIDIETPDGVADAYLSKPEGDARGSVLFMFDAYGLRPRIYEMADRIAAEGYAVLAPNLFYRAGRTPVLPFPDMSDEASRGEFFAQVMPLMGSLTPEALASDGAAYLDALGDGPVGITGYCMGARAGWRVAAAHPDRVAALGGFHGGRLVTDDPDSPHRSAGALRAEVYFGHADNDQSMTPENAAALDAALEEAGVPHRSEIYEGAAHGYTMSDTPAWNEAACERHYAALFDLLGRTLG